MFPYFCRVVFVVLRELFANIRSVVTEILIVLRKNIYMALRKYLESILLIGIKAIRLIQYPLSLSLSSGTRWPGG